MNHYQIQIESRNGTWGGPILIDFDAKCINKLHISNALNLAYMELNPKDSCIIITVYRNGAKIIRYRVKMHQVRGFAYKSPENDKYIVEVWGSNWCEGYHLIYTKDV